MPHIKINFDGLNQQANTIGSLAKTFGGLYGRMNTLTEEVKDGWTGQASGAFGEMMARYASQTQLMGTILEAFQKYAAQAAADFDQTDRACANAIRNAF